MLPIPYIATHDGSFVGVNFSDIAVILQPVMFSFHGFHPQNW